MKNVLLRIVGALIGLGGGGLLVGAAVVTVDGGVALMTSPGYLLVVFVVALSLLLVCGGVSLALFGSSGTSLVPPWALVVSGALMILAVIGLLVLGVRENKHVNPIGALIFGVLGFHWLRSGFRGPSANKLLQPIARENARSG